MNNLSSKIELAGLALQNQRFDEAEKLLQDVIFDQKANAKDRVSGWIAMGVVKTERFKISEDYSFQEIKYCFEKAFKEGDEVKQVTSAYFEVLLQIISYFSEVIKLALRQKNKESKLASFNASISILSGIASVATDSNVGRAIGISTGSLGAASFFNNLNNIKKISDIISDLQNKMLLIFNSFNQGISFIDQDLAAQFREKVTQDSVIQKQLGFGIGEGIEDFAKKYQNNVYSKKDILENVNKNSFFYKNSVFIQYRDKIKKNFDDIIFGIIGTRNLTDYLVLFTNSSMQVAKNVTVFESKKYWIFPYDIFKADTFSVAGSEKLLLSFEDLNLKLVDCGKGGSLNKKILSSQAMQDLNRLFN